ncbi:hypothetical protein F5Y10DRAFT_231188 [Nemania abortiva]|nr:hypothetical protein F5Y10DRAFT_231188 [Nemania abortiva]
MCDASSPYPGDHTVRHVLRLVDKLSRLTKSLVDPDMEHQMAMFPLSFGSLDLAVVEEQRVWKELFPFSKPNETLGDQIDKYPTGVVRSATKNYPKDPLVRKAELKIDTYPTATSDPITKRTYLCRLALAADTAAAKRHALFLAPIAFLIHRHRQDWYQVTSHKSRYYATIRDFLVYAEDFFGGSRNTLQDHLPALITPWFFSAASVTRHASITNRTAEETWEKACFRVGFVFLLSRLETRAQAGDHERRQYRLLIYKPGVAPRPLTKANSHLLGLQTGWINHAIGMIKKHYELDEIWSRGNTEFNNKGFCLDPMAASAKFIENIMLRYPGIPMKHSELLAKNFIQFPNHSRVWY